MTDKELRDWQEKKRLRGPDATEIITITPEPYGAFLQIHDSGRMDGLGAPAMHGVFQAHLERVLAAHKARVLLLLDRLMREDNLGWRLVTMTWIHPDGRLRPTHTIEQAAAELGISVMQAAGRRKAAQQRLTQWANEQERKERKAA